MNTTEKIIKLMENKNVTASNLTKILELSPSAITEWKKGKAKPSADALCKIADYFNVSVDYLLGRTENLQQKKELQPLTAETLYSEEEKKLIEIYRASPQQTKLVIQSMLYGIESQNAKAKLG